MRDLLCRAAGGRLCALCGSGCGSRCRAARTSASCYHAARYEARDRERRQRRPRSTKRGRSPQEGACGTTNFGAIQHVVAEEEARNEEEGEAQLGGG